MTDNSIEYSRHLRILREEMLRPSVLFQKSLVINEMPLGGYMVKMDNATCTAGWGKTVNQALRRFDMLFDKKN